MCAQPGLHTQMRFQLVHAWLHAGQQLFDDSLDHIKRASVFDGKNKEASSWEGHCFHLLCAQLNCQPLSPDLPLAMSSKT